MFQVTPVIKTVHTHPKFRVVPMPGISDFQLRNSAETVALCVEPYTWTRQPYWFLSGAYY